MPERYVETMQHQGPTQERAHRPILHVAIFDLAQQAFASAGFVEPTLLQDPEQPLPRPVSHEHRIGTLHTRHHLGLPPLKVMGRLQSPDEGVVAYAVKPLHGQSINFRDFALRRYHLDDLRDYVESAQEAGQANRDVQIIGHAFKTIAELKKH
ncbi:MAG TPA: hypothetical protein VN081_00920 [Dongiaceae bacterium]|nr:hypothetical protein [Dongiaceae bacterium]